MLRPIKILISFFYAFAPSLFVGAQVHKESTFYIQEDTSTININIATTLDRDNTAGDKVSYRWDLYRYYKFGFEPLKSFSLKNTGTSEVNSIVFTFNEKRNWQSLNSIADEIFKGYYTQKEKALALWKFVLDNHVYFYKPEDLSSLESQDPVKFLTVYGYGDCFTMSNTVKMLNAVETKDSLWIWGLNGGAHGITEVKIDTGYAVLDADQQAFYLQLNNKTLASYDDIRMDKYLYIRTKRFPQLYPFYTPKNFTDFETMVSADNSKSAFSDYGTSDHSALITLRPNETISFYYDSAKKYHLISPDDSTLPAETDILSFIGTGTQKYSPAPDQLKALFKRKKDSFYSIIKLTCPFVLTGGKLSAKLTIPPSIKNFSISYSEDGSAWRDIYTTTDAGAKNIVISLDTLIMPLVRPAVYSIYIKLNFLNSQSYDLTSLVDSFEISADFQVSKFFLPRLKKGDNRIQVVSGKSNAKKLELSLAWDEDNSNSPPAILPDPVFPPDQSMVDSTFFMFKWHDGLDADKDSIKDYHFQLSDDSLMRFPLVSNFDIYVSSFDSLIRPQLKSGVKDFLNDGETYYWRVRALDSRGAWSDWSPVWKFIPHGPLQPRHLAYDTTSTGFILKWNSALSGNKAISYRIYASNDRGFYPTDAANIASTTDTTFKISFAAKNYKYYRVAAVDKFNNQSAVTNYLTIPDMLQLTDGSSFKLDSISDNNYRLSYAVGDTSLISLNNRIIASKKMNGKTFLYIYYLNDSSKIILTDKLLINVGRPKLYFIPTDNSKIYGESNPEIKWTVSGFENGDSFDSIDILPQLKFDLTTFSNAGTYPVYFEGGSDDRYEIVSDTGEFVIGKKMLTVTADTIAITQGHEIPKLTYNIAGFAGNEDISVIDVLPVASTRAVSESYPGTYEIVLSGGQDNNYSFDYRNAVLLIQAESLLVKPNPSKGIFTVYSSSDLAGKQIQIINSYGQRLTDQTINTPAMTFNFSNYAPGMYFLKVIDSKDNKMYGKRKILIIK